MILSGSAIQQAAQEGRLTLHPFRTEQVNPNSYDLCLGSTLLTYEADVLDPFSENITESVTISDGGYVLKAKQFYLGHSVEVVGSDHFVPMLHCKSGIARLGLFIHVTADLIDIGSKGNITFQMHPTVDLRVYPGMRIAQMSFWSVQGSIQLYSGKYQGSVGPVASLSYLSKD